MKKQENLANAKVSARQD